ncbi:MAG: RNA polymerase sigma factor [Ignavibacteria bacterium]|nr:RNA polymerase sigma factor [Ignavibacteria bacterium]
MNKICHICVVKIRIDVKDAELIESFKKGNRYAFEQLVKKYQKNIYWHARRMTGNHFDADEIAQEVIITIYNKISSFRYESELSTWIYRITANKTINYLRKEYIKKFFSIENVTKKDSNDIVKNLEDKQKLEKLNEVLGGLPIKQREVFLLRHFEGMNYNEISKVTGKTEGSLKANYHHAITKILKRMNYEVY